MASQSIFVYYRVIKPNGEQYENNSVLTAVPKITNLDDIIALQAAIAKINNAVDAKIISWQRLEGNIIH